MIQKEEQSKLLTLIELFVFKRSKRNAEGLGSQRFTIQSRLIGDNMPALNDAHCPKCNHRFGWVGENIDRPPCPYCGHQISKECLEEEQKEIDAFQAFLLERKKKRDGR